MSIVSLRPATIDDVKFIYELSSDRDVRRNSFNQHELVYDDHVHWFEDKLKQRDYFIYIVLSDGKRAGQVRVQIVEYKGIISYSIDKNFRGQGCGEKALALLSNEMLEKTDIKMLVGMVKKENTPSRKAFAALDYKQRDMSGILEFSKVIRL
ncbi:MAG: GNAT family N-acetyltransferase [Oscillospiraceae bacterium]